MLIVMKALPIALAAVVLAASPAMSAPDPTYTYKADACQADNRVDPLNVKWFGLNSFSVVGEVEARLHRWGPVPGGFQSAFNNGDCDLQAFQIGREFGPPSADGSKDHKEKIHIRLFDTGDRQVSGDAHREHKTRCAPGDSYSHDVVYRRFNGLGGFDAAMNRMVKAYKKYDTTDTAVVRSRGPFVNAFKQCNGQWVRWSGDVTYITR